MVPFCGMKWVFGWWYEKELSSIGLFEGYGKRNCVLLVGLPQENIGLHWFACVEFDAVPVFLRID